jgi:hypothetical protein
MSILNVNQIQPVGGGNTITVSASDVSASGVTITASSFVGPVTGNVTSSSTSTFSSGINVTGGSVGIGTDNPTTILHLRDNSPILTTEASNGASGLRVNVLGQSSSTSQLFRIQNDNSTKFTILKSGNVQIADGNLVVASGHGIDFSADGNASEMTSELLDDYEEGTWTPVLKFGGANAGMAASYWGKYTKIGRMVYYFVQINLTNKGSSTGDGIIEGLPFTGGPNHCTTIAHIYSANSLTGPIIPRALYNGTNIILYQQSTNGYGSVTDANFNATSQIHIVGTYFT